LWQHNKVKRGKRESKELLGLLAPQDYQEYAVEGVMEG
jgi:hypothetical protein